MAFDPETPPHSILIASGGYIAAEFAAILASLGVNTTLIYRGDCILRGFDEALRRGPEAELVEHGVKLIYQTTIMPLIREHTAS